MVTLAHRVRDAAEALANVTDTPRLDAELLVAHASGQSRGKLLARLGRESHVDGLDGLLGRRLNHESVAHILGVREFYSIPIAVHPPVLVPRPETEHLVEAVVEFVGSGPARVLDLCTGSGCVAIAIARNAKRARVVAVDIASVAAATARGNVRAQGLDEQVSVCQSDLINCLGARPVFDAICANAPYVSRSEYDALPPDIRLYEDPKALLGGEDGLEVNQAIIVASEPLLKPGGLLALEIDPDQAGAVREMFTANAFVNIAFRRDLGGYDRIATANKRDS